MLPGNILPSLEVNNQEHFYLRASFRVKGSGEHTLWETEKGIQLK